MFTLATSYTTPYPSNRLHKATNFKTMFDTTLLPYNSTFPCQMLCYTSSKNFIYKPHSGYGSVGTNSSASRGQRRRL